MSEHLPECWHNPEQRAAYLCICDRLRACEQRVMNRVQSNYVVDIEMYRDKGYAEALDRAREAVVGLDEHDSCVGFNGPAIYREDALDAIDALRGES